MPMEYVYVVKSEWPQYASINFSNWTPPCLWSLPHFVVCVCVGGSLKSRSMNYYELQFTPAILSTNAFCDSLYAALCLLLSSHASSDEASP